MSGALYFIFCILYSAFYVIFPCHLSVVCPHFNHRLSRTGYPFRAVLCHQHLILPYNRTQFKRILKEAVIRTDGPYICAKTIQEVIQRENVLFSGFPFPVHACSGSTKEDADAVPGNSRLAVSHPSPFCLDTSQSLDEMNRDIVHYVLNACKGNQTAAAKKLGISRTTLWRYLNR